MTTERMEKDMKILFDKIGMEKSPEDFTARVMQKIDLQSPYYLSHALPKSTFWFLLPYLVAMLIVVPFIIPTINWIINIDWSFISLDISVIREWFGQLADIFAGISISTQTLVITLSCSVLLIILSIEMFVQSRRIFN